MTDGRRQALPPAASHHPKQMGAAKSARMGLLLVGLLIPLLLAVPAPAQTTRFYLQNAAPGYTPPTARGAWNNSAASQALKLSTIKAGAIATKAVTETSGNNNYDVLLLKLVSDPLPAQTVASGALNWVVGAQENSDLMNAHWHVHVFATQGDSDTVRATLLNNFTEAAGTNEWPTTAQGRGPNNGTARNLNSFTLSAGDRIVIEVGYVARNNTTGTFYGTLWFGGTGPDLTLGGDETTSAGFFEFNGLVASTCGNGAIETGEQCDDGAGNGTTTCGCTNACAYPSAGALCNDGNACTQTDTCNGSGTCTGSNPVTCTASDQCHDAGTCNPGTGQCSNPAKANGTTCSDGDACTQSDTCQSGTCTGSNPVTCTASDQCHDAGTCNPGTGQCSNPAKANGTTCSDGDVCTQSDTCQSGTCSGSNPVTCTASDQCHDAGTCNPGTGQCSNPAKANGTTCSDGNPNTSGDQCSNGVCVGAAGTCGDGAVDEGTEICDDGAANGTTTCGCTTSCSYPGAGTVCDDGNSCTHTDTCQNGTCAGSSPAVCAAQDQCHNTGTCDPGSGQCSNPMKQDGTPCNDNNPNTVNDVCTAGVCAGTLDDDLTYPVTFTYTMGSPNTLSVAVLALVTCPETCPSFSYDWDWGDGSAHGSGQAAWHTYAAGGRHSTRLTVTLYGRVVGSVTRSIVLETPDLPPTADGTCTWDQNTWTMIFVDASTDDGPDVDTSAGDGNGSLQIVINWGDGGMKSISTQGATVSHTYLRPGRFTVNYRAIDRKLQQASRTCSVDATPTYFTVGGRVLDHDGITPVPSASVMLIRTSTGSVFKRVYTAADGSFLAGALKPGSYTLKPAKPGYAFPLRGPITVGPSNLGNVIRAD